MLATDYQPSFGIPFPKEFNGVGKLSSKLTTEEAQALAAVDPERAKLLASLLKTQPMNARLHPAKWGWRTKMWKKVMEAWKHYRGIVILGGNRSGKSTFAGRLMSDALEHIDEAELRGFHVTMARSRKDQQRFIYESLPKSLLDMEPKKGVNWSLTYSQKNGWSGDEVIIPPTTDPHMRGSYMYFNTYHQFMQDQQAIEGLKAHAIWCDEECPAGLYETMFARISDYRGRIILTFTTLQGYTDLVGSIIRGAKTIESRHSEYMGEELPIMQESKNWPGVAIFYFWSEDNPFHPYWELQESYQNQPREVKLARLYGIPTKNQQTRFSGFHEDVNVIEHREIPFIKDPTIPVTRYHVVDPAGGKNWVNIWAGVTENNDCYIYHEWPGVDMGPWGIPMQNAQGNPVGKPGPAQNNLMWGFEQYAKMFREVEGNDIIFERIMDSRGGKDPQQVMGGNSDIMSEMGKIGYWFRPASGLHIDHGLQKVADCFRGSAGGGRLYISNQCVNLIECVNEYTGMGGQKEVWKDFIDPLRYLVLSPARYCAPSSLRVKLAGGY